MIELALTGPERKTYYETLLSSHSIRTKLTILDQDEEHSHEWNVNVISGQVDYSIGQPRRLTLQVRGYVPFEPNSPSEAAVYAHRMIRIQYEVHVSDLERYISVPVFWGPITQVTLGGDGTTTVEAQGKEVLLQEPHVMWRTFTRKKGAAMTEVLKDLLRAVGETRLDIPDLDRKLPKPFSVTPDEAPWDAVRRLSNSLNRQFFYDGRGFARLRQMPENSQWTWRTPLTRPELIYSMSEFRNTVKVYGPETHGKYERVKAVAILPPSHPLSPVALARNGVPRYLVEVLGVNAPTPPTKPDDKASASDKAKYNRQYDRWAEHYHIRQKHAEEVATTTLRQKSAAILEATFNASPVPDIEEGDMFTVAVDDKMAQMRFSSGTLPLRADDSGMAVGYHRRISWKTRRTILHGGVST